MKLELKHLSAYLPYEVKVKHNFEKVRYNPKGSLEDWVRVLEPSMLNYFIYGMETEFKYKPILRPLSDLTKEIEHNGEKFVPMEFFASECEDDYFEDTDFERYIEERLGSKDNELHMIKYLPYGLIQKIIEWHFDVFVLIEKGLAIDINEIK